VGALALALQVQVSTHPIEKICRALKGTIAANRMFRTLAERDAAIAENFADFSAGRALTLVRSSVGRRALAAVPQIPWGHLSPDLDAH